MAKFNPYTWWKRGVKINPPTKKKPKGATEPLIWYQILNGDFKESPFWEMSNQEFVYWKQEVEDTGIDVVSITVKLISIASVDVTEDVDLWFYLLHSF